MLISWSRGRSGQLQNCTFSLPTWVQNTHRAPHSPPECWIFSKCQWFGYNIKYIAFRWGIGGFGLGEQLIGTVWGDFCMGTTIIFFTICACVCVCVQQMPIMFFNICACVCVCVCVCVSNRCPFCCTHRLPWFVCRGVAPCSFFLNHLHPRHYGDKTILSALVKWRCSSKLVL